jgi:hypothetical protein
LSQWSFEDRLAEELAALHKKKLARLGEGAASNFNEYSYEVGYLRAITDVTGIAKDVRKKISGEHVTVTKEEDDDEY